jgi:uncharacterized protein involved in exopolysaccharide biosynthesis
MEMEERSKNLKEYLDFLSRRRIQILIPAGIFLVLALTLAFLLPPVYRSTSMILIEEQEVPPDLVRSTVTSYADQRIQTIKYQVMTRSNLLKIVEQYKLYEKLRWRETNEEILKRMVDDINIQVISAEVVDRRTGQQTHATIAFTLSYDGETPAVAQKVTNELTSLFLAENLRNRERSAEETTAFLKKEAGDLALHIKQLEKKIAVFKLRAKGALPELVQLNIQLMNQTDQELMQVDQEIRSLEDRKIYLDGQLATIKPNTPIVTAAGERILDPGERLKALRAQYVSSASYLSPQHPDIMKMKREIEALEKETGESPGKDEYLKKLTGERTKLAALVKQYGEDHPDVIQTRKVIAALEAEISQASNEPENPTDGKPENPAYINVQTQLSSTVNDLEALKATRVKVKAKAQEYAERVENTGMIEQEYLDLTRDRDNSVLKYHEIRSKLLEAQISEGLETQRKGERFSLIDPPALPEKPVKPNRVAILVLGVVFAMAGGVGYGAAAESLDQSVRTAPMLEKITQTPPLAIIPYLPSLKDQIRRVKQKRNLILGGVFLAVGLLILVHFLWFPLDVLWFTMVRKLGL